MAAGGMERQRSTQRQSIREHVSSSATGRTDRSKAPCCVCRGATSSRATVSKVLRRRRVLADQSEPLHKLSRQQRRAQAREKRDAEGWIAALDIQDLALQQGIRAAI